MKLLLLSISFISFIAMAQTPILFYDFDENIEDHSPNSWATSSDQIPVYVEGTQCMAIKIGDNTSDVLRIDHNVLDGLEDFSISVYVKINGLNNSNNLISAHGNHTDNSFILSYNANSGGYFENDGWQIYLNGQNFSFQSDFAMNNMDWHHIVMKRTSGFASLYVDNVKIGADIFIGNSPLNVVPNGFVIGQDQDCVSGCFEVGQSFHGEIDELRIYDVAIDDEKISEIFKNRDCSILSIEKLEDPITFNSYKNENLHVSFFPNPSNGLFNIYMEDFNYANYQVDVIDFSGKVVHTSQITNETTTIDLVGLNLNGVFLLRLTNSFSQVMFVDKLFLY